MLIADAPQRRGQHGRPWRYDESIRGNGLYQFLGPKRKQHGQARRMSETSDGWFLTHGDGTVHGPFTLAALVEAARQGNISNATQVRHETHTQGQWIPAHRIRPIAEVLSQKMGPATPTPTQPGPSQPAPAQPAPAQRGPAQPTPPSARQTSRAAHLAASSSPPVATGEAAINPAPAAINPAPAAIDPTPAAINPPGNVDPAPSEVGGSVASEEVSVAVSSAPRLGRGKHTLIVPQTLGAAMLAIFDFRFRYYITPWIIKITWGICVVLATLAFVLFTVGFVIRPLVSSAASDSGSVDVVITDDFGRSNASPGNWAFEPPTTVMVNMWRIIGYTSMFLAYGFGLLYLRMFLETAIVLFHIATDLSDIRESFREK